ncbi:MAG: sugar ABC transporter ATP-binding protein, partial [Clostridia bacterium]|nr:sugar ABC transporter ATP-binding protein [Clostridia bacterium]
KKTTAEAKKYTEMVGLDVDVNTLVGSLSLAQRQMVEVAKALSTNAKLIVMDEPTSALTDRETVILMGVIRKLRDSGVTVVFISHRLSELFEITERITVLRDGECIGTINTEDCTEQRLIDMMVGRSLGDIYPEGSAAIGETILDVKNLNAGPMVQDVSFELHSGEILGFAGLVGAGRSEVMRAIFGVDRMESGSIVVDGKTLHKHTPTDAIHAGIGLVPEDRKLLGLILDMTVRENTTLPCLEDEMKHGLMNRKTEARISDLYIKQLEIKTPSREQKVVNLSGGNQQKVVIAKWLATHPKVLIMDEPTRGIDVGAKREIYELMRKLASEGVGIIMISSEMPEVLGMSDRIIVMQGGRICGELPGSGATQEEIMGMILKAAN